MYYLYILMFVIHWNDFVACRH